jgi:hypothetical protein
VTGGDWGKADLAGDRDWKMNRSLRLLADIDPGNRPSGARLKGLDPGWPIRDALTNV